MTQQQQRRAKAVARAVAHAPFLRDAMLLHPDILALFELHGAETAVASALAKRDEPIGVALRGQRHRLALAVALGDLAGELALEQVTRILSDFADYAIEAALAQAMA